MKSRLATLALLLFAVAARAGTVTLPYYNEPDASTTLVIENPTGSPAVVAGAAQFPFAVAPFQTIRFSEWPRQGGATDTFTLPDGLEAFVEVSFRAAASPIRIHPMLPLTANAQVMGIISTETVRGYLLVDGLVQVIWYHDAVPLEGTPPLNSGNVFIYNAPLGANRAVLFASVISPSGAPFVVGFHATACGFVDEVVPQAFLRT